MNKNILNDYIDACELIKETEEDIRKLRRRESVYDKVKGSNPEFPYQPQSFSLTGIVEVPIKEDDLEKEEKLLLQRKMRAQQIKVQVERWMNEMPLRMQRIIRYKYFEKLSWEEVADRIGRKTTGDSLRMEFERFMKET